MKRLGLALLASLVLTGCNIYEGHGVSTFGQLYDYQKFSNMQQCRNEATSKYVDGGLRHNGYACYNRASETAERAWVELYWDGKLVEQKSVSWTG